MDNDDSIPTIHASTMLPLCEEKFKQSDKMYEATLAKIDKVDVALFGADGTDGLVEIIRHLEFSNKIMMFIGMTAVGIISSVVTALIIVWAGGRL